MIWYVVSHPLGYCAGTHTQVMQCKGYNLWSGIVSDIGEVTLVGMAIGLIKHRNCHVKGCKSVMTHPVPGTPFKACKSHNPAMPAGDISHYQIVKAHKEANQ